MTETLIEEAIAESIEENFFEDQPDERTVHEAFGDMLDKNPDATLDEFCATLTTTDTGNAERLEIRFGDMLRYIPAKKKDAGQWIAYNGKHWERESLAAAALMKRVAKFIPREVRFGPKMKAGEDDKSYAKRLAGWRDGRMKFATRSLGSRAMDDALKVARINLRAKETEFDIKPELLNTPHGTLCLTTGGWNPNHQDDMLTGITNASVRLNNPRVCFEAFIRDICKDAFGTPDLEKEHYLKVVLGYCLLGRNPEHLIFFFTGDETNEGRNGRNGKSLLMLLLRHVLGDDYCVSFQREMLIRANGREPEDKHRHCLLGRRIAFSPEYEKDHVVCSATMKALIGEDKFTGRYLSHDPFEANMTATLIIVSNFVPQMSSNGKTDVWSKVRRIRFLNRFWDGTGAEPEGYYQRTDIGLEARLKAEKDGILAWVIEGAVEYAQKGLPHFADAIESLAENRDAGDPIGEFLDTCVVREDGQKVHSGDFFNTYTNYAISNAMEPKNSTAFGRAVTAKNIRSVVDGGPKFRENVRLNLIGKAYLKNNDPLEACRFTACEVLPGFDIKQDAEGDMFGADKVKAVQGPRRVLLGEKMSIAELNNVRTGDEGEQFTINGTLYEIIKPGSSVELNIANVVPFKKAARR